MDWREKKTNHQIQIFLPLILITIGLVFFWANLDGQQSSGWELLFNLWPLIFVYAGLEGLFHNQGAGTCVFWITLGVAVLFANLQRITWTSWEIILTLWPIFLVAIGLDLMVGFQTLWRKSLAGLAVLGIMGGVLFFFDLESIQAPQTGIKIDQEFSSYTPVDIILEPKIGFISVNSQGSQTKLVEGNVYAWQGESISPSLVSKSDRVEYWLRSDGFAFIYKPGPKNRANWDLLLNSRLPIDLTVHQLIGEAVLDLKEIQLTGFSSDIKVGKLVVILPGNLGLGVKISHILGIIEIYVPTDAQVRLRGRPIIGEVLIPTTYNHIGDEYFSSGFSEESPFLNIQVNMVIGQILIRER